MTLTNFAESHTSHRHGVQLLLHDARDYRMVILAFRQAFDRRIVHTGDIECVVLSFQVGITIKSNHFVCNSPSSEAISYGFGHEDYNLKKYCWYVSSEGKR
jgi:hypothetical protein